MSIKMIVSCVCSFALGALLFGLTTSADTARPKTSPASQNTRAADREAIHAHIEKIFNAFVNSDCAVIRATHAQNWIGFTGTSRTIAKGLDGYLQSTARWCADGAKNPSQISGAKLVEIDYAFYGDIALVPYVAETTYGNPPRMQGKVRSLDIYAKQNGEWIQVGSNIYAHPDWVEAQRSMPGPLTPADKKALLESRDAAWRAYFANDQAQLDKLIPAEAMTVGDSNPNGISKREDIFEASKKLAAKGAKLERLEFPKTEIQLYGNTAIIYTTYVLGLAGNQPVTWSGAAIEVFVKRQGTWVNTGWLLKPDKK